MGAEYDSAVRKTFTESLRTVFLVDDSFPKYSDVISDKDYRNTFREWERARNLYMAFHNRHLPCDIENAFISGDEKMVERLRKCDLIVLDYLLDGDTGDSSKSIEILRHLSDSPHFNTVVVYTNEELDEVWLDVAANLRPDLRSELLERAHETEFGWWAEQDPQDYIELLSNSAIATFLTGGMTKVDRNVRAPLKKRLVEATKGQDVKVDILAEIVFRAAVDRRRLKTLMDLDKKVSGDRALQGRLMKDKPRWLQCRGCFIAIVQKAKVDDEVQLLMSNLDKALLDWNPNFLQILVSEIQNNLELELVAADPRLFSDPLRQVGLSHYLLQQLAAEDDPDSAIESVIDRIVETLRSGMSGEAKLHEFAKKVLADVRENLGEEIRGEDAIANAARFAHLPTTVEPAAVISHLNAFVSTEPFTRSRITTGTVFKSGDDFWMVASPACDLTGREPKGQEWMKSIHPLRSLLAVRLTVADLHHALKIATEGRHAFILHESKPVCLTVFDRQTSAPNTEMFLAVDAGRIEFLANGPVFRAHRIIRDEALPQFSVAAEFEVVGQLRPAYASRVLQMTGYHLARIGIDFFNVRGGHDAA